MTPFSRSGLFLALFFTCWIGVPSESRAGFITLDFEAATSGTLQSGVYLEDGFSISDMTHHYDILEGVDGERFMQIDTYRVLREARVRLDLSGNFFDFLGLDVVYWNKLDQDPVAFLTSSAGGYAEIADTGALNVIGSQWQNLSWVDFSIIDPSVDIGQDNFAFDNLRLRVSEPMTLTLTGLGLVGLALIRRRKPIRIVND